MLTNCHEEPETLALNVSPKENEVPSLYAGEKTLYEVTVKDPKGSGSRLQISSFDQEQGMQQLVDTTFTTAEGKYTFVYTAPEFQREKTEVKLTFSVEDNDGENKSTTRKVNVHSRSLTIKEFTGIVLYGPESGRPDALLLDDVTRPFILSESPRPDTADVYLTANADFGNITLRSNTETKFIRANTFNYSVASASAIVSVYENSIHSDLVRDLEVNDVIIVGKGGCARGVFFVSNILRGYGASDCIQLSYKTINSNE